MCTDIRAELISNQSKLKDLMEANRLTEFSIKIEPLDTFFDDSYDRYDDYDDNYSPIDLKPPSIKIQPEEESIKIPCRFCKMKFNEVKLLECHLVNKHKKLLSKEEISELRRRRIDRRKLVCSICGIKTHYIKHHMDTKHLKKKRFLCDLCNYQAFNKSEIQSHMYKHKEPNFVCDFCGNKFARKMALKRHINRSHLNIDGRVKKRNYPIHRQKATSTKDSKTARIKCNFCQKEMSKRVYKLHVEQVHTFSTEICDICHKTFKNKHALLHHKRNHKERIYKCDYPNCDKSFVTEYRLTHHKAVHKNLREFKCTYEGCDKSYFMRRVLNMHVALFHEKYTVNCIVPGCKFSVGRKDYMRNHVTKQHKDLPNDLLSYYLEQVKEMQLW